MKKQFDPPSSRMIVRAATEYFKLNNVNLLEKERCKKMMFKYAH